MSSNTAKKISVGLQHTCAIFDDDKVYCWGGNGFGQLGVGSTTDQNTPTVVNLGTGKTATAISSGSFHNCAILNDKTVKCWGVNSSGQVGDRSNTARTSPVAVPLGSGRSATAIHVNGAHSCAILDDGSLLCWGANNRGQLGDGTTTSRNTPVAVDLGEGRTATAVGGGSSHTCAILDDESLKCWGYNHNGETGLPTAHRGDQPGEMGENLIFVDLDIDKEEEVGPGITLALGGNHACAIDEDGTLACWGRNDDGQLGVSTTDNDVCPVNNTNYDCIRAPVEVDLGTGRSAKMVSLGHVNHTCAILDNGSLLCWGSTALGKLGIGTTNLSDVRPTGVNLGGRSATGVSLGESHTCALLDDKSVKCWGSNGYGQLGTGNTTNSNTPVSVTFADNKSAVEVSAGIAHTCAILDDNSLVCWGHNGNGRLGVTGSNDDCAGTVCMKTPTTVDLGEGRTALAVGLGEVHTCALLDDGSVKCWGANAGGELGDGSTTGRNTPVGVGLGASRTAVALTVGIYHSCAILDNEQTKCWGRAGYGAIGDGYQYNRANPTNVNVGSGRVAKEIYVGRSNTCAVLDDNSVVCWGANYFGQLLDGTTIDRYGPVRARL